MGIKVVLLVVVALTVCFLITTVSASEILIEDADTIWNGVASEYQSELSNLTKNVTPRVISDRANSIYRHDLGHSTDLGAVAGDVTPRVLIEYSNSIYRHDLDGVSTDLDDLTGEVPLRIIMEYANSNYYHELTFPKALINDVMPPQITNVTVTNITNNSATIKWDTDEFSDSLVKYGKVSGIYTEEKKDLLFSKNHSIILGGLSEGTKYYFVVGGTDLSGNLKESSEYSFSLVGQKNGDVNGDGEVTLFDAMYLAKHVLGESGFEEINEEASDVNGDAEITLFDAMYLAKYVLGEEGFGVLK